MVLNTMSVLIASGDKRGKGKRGVYIVFDGRAEPTLDHVKVV